MTDHKTRFYRHALSLLVLALVVAGCENVEIRDTQSLLFESLQKSEVWGFLAGFGTTFAAMPDLTAMFRRRSGQGMNPRMAGILGVFQVIWIYYGLLIGSRPVIAWNLLAVVINFTSVGAFVYFRRRERFSSAQLTFGFASNVGTFAGRCRFHVPEFDGTRRRQLQCVHGCAPGLMARSRGSP